MIQDDSREAELRKLFGLRTSGEGRGGTDAVLDIDGRQVPFELKSTTRGSVTTVRDFGPHYGPRWRDKHWLIGWYGFRGDRLLYAIYASPPQMAPWIEDKIAYVQPDFSLAEYASEGIGMKALHAILGSKPVYSLDDAKRIQKRQHSLANYRDRMDRPDGYSPERMLEILRDRARYVMSRGATLNNPHIPQSYFADWPRIDADHAAVLRERVRAYFDASSAQ